MKNLPILRGSLRNSLGCLLLIGTTFHSAWAQNAVTTQILQNTADQQDVRQHTAAVVAEAQALIDELAANGISGDDVKVLNSTKAALTNLSGPEMDRVIAALKKAAGATTTAEGQKEVVQAYGGEKTIILQFQQILKDYEQRQAAYELPLKFKDLANRQDDTLNTTVAVARKSAGKSAVELNSMDQTTQQIAQADQDAIASEVALAQQSLDKAAKESTDDTAQNMQQAEKDMKSGTLQKALADADDALKAGQLLKAITAQKVARDQLHQIAKDLTPETNAVDALKDTAASIDKIIQEQKALLGETNAAVDVKPRVTGLDDKQGVIVNETDSLQKDTQTLSASSAALVGEAIAPMQTSRSLLGPHGGADSFNKAATSEEDAIAKLEAAEAQVNQQVADAQKAADDAAKDPVAKLQQLQQQIQAAQQAQQQLNTQTAQADAANPPPATAQAQQQAQNQIQQQTAAAQDAAQPVSLQASQALADAANQMNQAQQDMANQAAAATPDQAAQQAAAAQQAQQAAAQDLAQANQQVNQQIQQAQQQPPDPAALAQAADALQQAQNDVANAVADTPPAGAQPPAAGAQPPAAGAPPAGAPPAGANNMAAAAAALAQAAKDTDTAAQTPGLPADAAADVKNAQADIAKGEQTAQKGDAPGTAAAAAAAQQALAQAQASVAMAQAGLAGAAPPPPGGAGGPPDNGPPDGGPPMPGGPPAPGDTPGDIAATSINGGSTTKGTLHDTLGNGKFITVTSRDRAAIDQTQTEKRPQEFAPMIDQYMKNLSDQASATR
jgi:hypothetical protein